MKEDAERIQEEGIVSEDGDHLVSKKKKAKKQGYEEEVEGIKKKKKKKEAEVKEEEADLGHCVEMVKKKKKKRKIDDVAEREQNTESADGQIKKKRKKQKEADACEGVEQKAKKKKKSSAEEEPDEISSKKKSKKLKKKLKSVDEGESRPHANGGQERPSDEKMKKKVKERTDDVIEVQEELAGKKGRKDDRNKTPEKIKKKKPKEEHHETTMERAIKASDVVFLSVKPGNQDEVSIDQARRLALQRDIDMESQPEPNLGQWGTAQFDSSDRQAKFLRLMGGFKKSSQPLTGSSGQASMALGKEGQQTLQQGLLGEFERAQSRRMDFRNKGAGLGFAAPSNKKFAIDVNARNSVRFDD
ncbi:lysine-rich nucleolar protein 1 [Cyprinus carpio]|uniref:Lysine-rich nucleolar protein 1 n=1 Tax=Cyprinus carpio TaxID=7962 RepID=A0A9Q9ZTI6_CYPCA|nr:lysine-rich nucleolar protein 1 [Cyprinus carpio]